MVKIICEIILSTFFVYGLYCAMNEFKCLLKRLVKRISVIDKKQS